MPLFKKLNLSLFCLLGTTSVLVPNVWTNQNLKVDTSSLEWKSGSYDCEIYTLCHDHGLNNMIVSLYERGQGSYGTTTTRKGETTTQTSHALIHSLTWV